MDNVTHSLFAITLARTPLRCAGRGTTAALILASNIPDIDIVTTTRGAGNYLTWHRGPTHGPLGILGLGIVAAGLVWLGRRLVDAQHAQSDESPENATFLMLTVVAVIGALLHVLMDLPTSYGTRLLSPFNWHWFTTDWMPIVDVYLLVALAAGLAFGRGSPEATRRNAAIVLALMAANYGVRAVAHHEAIVRAPRVFGPLLPQRCEPSAIDTHVVDSWPRMASPPMPEQGHRCLVDLIALPTFFSPFSWRVIAHLSNAYEIHDINLLDPRLRQIDGTAPMWRTTMHVPNVWNPAVVMAVSAPLAQRFLGFSRLPVVGLSADSGGLMVRLTDVRFIGPITFDPTGPRYGLFTVFVRLSSDGRFLNEQLRP